MTQVLRWTPEQLEAYQKRLGRGASPPESSTLAAKAPRKSKMGNRRTTVNGEAFDSQREADRYRDLLLLFKAGEISKPARQVRFPLPGGVHYVADFLYFDLKRGIVVEDAKGFRTAQYRDKAKQMRAIWGITILET